MKTEIKQRSMSLVLGNGMAKSPLSMVRRHKWKTKKNLCDGVFYDEMFLFLKLYGPTSTT